LSTTTRPALGPTQPTLKYVPAALSPGVKRPERETDQSPPSSAEIKNAGAIPPLAIRRWAMLNYLSAGAALPLLFLHIMHEICESVITDFRCFEVMSDKFNLDKIYVYAISLNNNNNIA
jgi:hypothetical protein